MTTHISKNDFKFFGLSYKGLTYPTSEVPTLYGTITHTAATYSHSTKGMTRAVWGCSVDTGLLLPTSQTEFKISNIHNKTLAKQWLATNET